MCRCLLGHSFPCIMLATCCPSALHCIALHCIAEGQHAASIMHPQQWKRKEKNGEEKRREEKRRGEERRGEERRGEEKRGEERRGEGKGKNMFFGNNLLRKPNMGLPRDPQQWIHDAANTATLALNQKGHNNMRKTVKSESYWP